MSKDDLRLTDVVDAENYFQNEAWFEVSRYHPDIASSVGVEKPEPRPYVLIINSYGRLRKLYTDTGGYEDVPDGGQTYKKGYEDGRLQ